MVSGVQQGINMSLSLGEAIQEKPQLEVYNDNSAALDLVKSGPEAAFKTRHISMRAHYVHDLVGANVLKVFYVPSEENAADACTKGLAAAKHDKACSMLRLEQRDQ